MGKRPIFNLTNSWINLSIEIIKANLKPIIISSILASPIILLITLGTSAFVGLTLSIKIVEKIKESKEGSINLKINDFNIFEYYLKGFKIFFYLLGVLFPFILIILLLILTSYVGYSFLLRMPDLYDLIPIFIILLYLAYVFFIIVANVVRYYFLYLYDDLVGFREIFVNVYRGLFKNILTSIFIVFIGVFLGAILSFFYPFVFFCSLTFLMMLPNSIVDVIILSYMGSKSIEERMEKL